MNTAHSECRPSTSISLSTISSYSLPYLLPRHLHLSTGRHPIIHTPTFQMPKPPQSATPKNIRHTLHTQNIVQNQTSLHIPRRHPTLPYHHHPFRPFQTLQICFLHRPDFIQSHMSIHSGNKDCISFPLGGMMQLGLPE